MQEFDRLADEELEKLAWHDIPVARLKKLCNPWASWVELDRPITQAEVRACLRQGGAELSHTPLWTELAFGRSALTAEENRQGHIRKIAWFVQNGFNEPISLEVGCEGLGVLPGHLVEDGNHRLAAAIMRKDKTIPARIGGGLSDAKRMGLWAPNAAQVECERRWDAARRRPRLKGP